MDNDFYNRVGNDRIGSRQIDELIGLARGLVADGEINLREAEFLQKWLAANLGISDHPLMATLYCRVDDILRDGVLDSEEAKDLLDTLGSFSSRDFELGETLKSTTLPLCQPAPQVAFPDRSFCFTGTFNYGQRRDCEAAVTARGGKAGSLTQKTNFLVIGVYATESWKHSSFGNKILKACEFRDDGIPISIVSEKHWANHLR